MAKCTLSFRVRCYFFWKELESADVDIENVFTSFHEYTILFEGLCMFVFISIPKQVVTRELQVSIFNTAN